MSQSGGRAVSTLKQWKNLKMIQELRQISGSILAMDILFPEVLAVVEGNNPGWVFVDDLNAPRAALVWAQGIEGFYLVGDAKSKVFLEELSIFTERVLKPRLNDLGKTWVEISGDKYWDPVIEKVYVKRTLESNQQWVYMLKPTRHKLLTQRKPVGDCELKTMDENLFVDLSAESKEFLITRLRKFWGSLKAFLSTGIGYVLVDGDEIVSLCFSSFVAGNIHVVDIETKELQRRRGYAEIVSQAYIADSIDRRFQLHWDCMAENTASARLAEKLGFRKSHVYTLYSFSLQ